MLQPWSEIAAQYAELAEGRDDEPFRLACREVGSLATTISQTRLNGVLFGWTSMHDLCIQQLDLPPGSGPCLKISPLRSGRIGFRLVDTHIATRQWHREVDATDTANRFVGFLVQLKWVDEADSLLSKH